LLNRGSSAKYILRKNKKDAPQFIGENVLYSNAPPHNFPPLKHPYHYLPIALPFTNNNRMVISNIDNNNTIAAIVVWY